MKLSIVHCFRSPVGGLFRHVCDLVRGQAERGASVGLVCDSATESEFSREMLSELSAICSLGIERIPMGRNPGWRDFNVLQRVIAFCRRSRPMILHGHGAKGGVYARLAARKLGIKSVYTPHGGSLHYSWASPEGAIYLALERWLKNRTDGFIFESRYAFDTYQSKLGTISGISQVNYNGLRDSEFEPLIPDEARYDFVYIGELRKLKGVGVLLRALKVLKWRGTTASLLLVGAGPDADYFKHQIASLGLQEQVTLSPPVFPATQAMRKGRIMVIPSLGESFPYIVLEAVAAAVPSITTRVGGIPEIFGPYAADLLPPGDARALASVMERALNDDSEIRERSRRLQSYAREQFNFSKMIDESLAFYEKVL